MKILIVSIIAILLRWYIEVPNFAPIGALAIAFSYQFKNKLYAASLFWLTLLLSDGILGLYNPMLMLMVYFSYIGYIASRNPFVGSFVFFVLSNFAVYLTSNYYDNPMQAIVAGIPFYKYTLISDLIFYYVYMNVGAIEQLVNSPTCHVGDCGFESRSSFFGPFV